MLRLQLLDQPTSSIKLSSLPVSIGTDAKNNLVLIDTKTSDFHAEIHCDEQGLYLVDLLSCHGSFINEHRVTSSHRLNSWDIIRLGHQTLEIIDPNSRRPGGWALRQQSEQASQKLLDLKPVTIIGRDPDCDLNISSHLLSRRHAEIKLCGTYLRVTDLESSNGTYINGQRIREGKAYPGDEVRFDEQSFFVVGPEKENTQPENDDDKTGIRQGCREMFASNMHVDDTHVAHANKEEQNKSISAEVPHPPPYAILRCSLFTSPNNTMEIRKERINIGRSNNNDLILLSPGISKSHASLIYSTNHWELHDNNSRNGILINGQKSQHSTLKHSDVLTIGDTELIFEIPHFDQNDDTALFCTE